MAIVAGRAADIEHEMEPGRRADLPQLPSAKEFEADNALKTLGKTE